ncbi:MAG: rhodanese-like domain-containing protein [Methylococcaceae bacterium]
MAYTPLELVAAAKQNISEVTIETTQSDLSTNLILDVREPAEYAAGFLPGAINIPRGVLEFKINEHPNFQGKQDANITVYCRTGGRSALATEALNKLGYYNAVSMAGGFSSWKDNGLQVIQP